jgi:hypothetical protein
MDENDLTLDEATVTSVRPDLFDDHGRRIPPELKAAVHRDTRRRFICPQPKTDYGAIHARIKEHLGATGPLSAAEFEDRAEAILSSLRNNSETKNIAQGVRVPFLLPKASYADFGQALDSTYLPAVQRSFQQTFPECRFTNYCKSGLAGKLGVAAESRHQRLLAAMQQGVVVGYYFPCLLEYSVPAAVEQMQTLPAKFLLAGGFDTCAAFVGCPDLLLRRDGYPPLLWLAALSGEKEGVGYHFEAYGYNLTFNRRPHFGHVAEYWASSLVVLG